MRRTSACFLENGRQLEVNIYRRAPGQLVTLEVVRGDRALKLSVPVSERPRDPDALRQMVSPDANLVRGLGQGCLGLKKAGAGLTDLLVQLWCFDFGQDLPGARPVANINVASAQIAVSAGVDRRVGECLDVAGKQQVRLSGGALDASCVHYRQA